MAPSVPRFSFKLNKLKIPSLKQISDDLGKDVLKKLSSYSTEYAEILLKHLTTETEVQIVNGCLSESSQRDLEQLESEKAVLQYRSQLRCILDAWTTILLGQPVFPEVNNYLFELREEIFEHFEMFIYELQAYATRKMRAENKQLIQKACSDASQIRNLTEVSIPAELDLLLKNGPNMVPIEARNVSEIKKLMESDIISAAVKFSWDENKVYPLFTQSAGLKIILEQLATQAPSNSKQVEFYATLYEEYKVQYNKLESQLAAAHFIDSKNAQNIVPEGTILTTSDKNLGPVLLPIEWYIEQYKTQSVKGNHVVTKMSADQCINLLKRTIENFRTDLLPLEKIEFKKYFSKSSPDVKVGVLKLVPKIHKLANFDSQSWRSLPSRPIRGAENCPVNPYSIALCKMLQEMHSSLKVLLTSTGIGFPIIYGCDEFSNYIHQVNFDRSTWSMKTLISGDFSDAYTKSSLHDLHASISKLGTLSKWPVHKVNLAKKLAELVFENCYFETPSGILKQTQGFPMGGHSSREGLDNILLSSEVELLSSPLRKALLSFYRMVDDISLVLDGPFSNVRDLLDKMAEVYPQKMPLNIQISFGYSHFLDSHVHNFLQSSQVNRLTTSLAYKPLAKFDYVPFSSNIAPLYKGKYNSPLNLNFMNFI